MVEIKSTLEKFCDIVNFHKGRAEYEKIDWNNGCYLSAGHGAWEFDFRSTPCVRVDFKPDYIEEKGWYWKYSRLQEITEKYKEHGYRLKSFVREFIDFRYAKNIFKLYDILREEPAFSHLEFKDCYPIENLIEKFVEIMPTLNEDIKNSIIKKIQDTDWRTVNDYFHTGNKKPSKEIKY